MTVQDAGSGASGAASWAASVPVHDLAQAIALAVGTKPVPCVSGCHDKDTCKGHTAAGTVSFSQYHMGDSVEGQLAEVACCSTSQSEEPLPSRTRDNSAWLSHSGVKMPSRRPTPVEILAAADADAPGTSSPTTSPEHPWGPWQLGLDSECCTTSGSQESHTAQQRDQQQELSCLSLKCLSSDNLDQQQQQNYYLEVVAYSPTSSSSSWDSPPHSVTGDDAPDVAGLPPPEQQGTTPKKKKNVTWGPDVILYDPAAEARARSKQQQRFWQKLLSGSSSSGGGSSIGAAVPWGVPCMPALTAVAAVAATGVMACSVIRNGRRR